MTLIFIILLLCITIVGFVSTFLQFNLLVQENQELVFKINTLNTKVLDQAAILKEQTDLIIAISKTSSFDYFTIFNSVFVQTYLLPTILVLGCGYFGVSLLTKTTLFMTITNTIYWFVGLPVSISTEAGFQQAEKSFIILNDKINALLLSNNQTSEIIAKSELLIISKESLINSFLIKLSSMPSKPLNIADLPINLPVYNNSAATSELLIKLFGN